MGIVLEECPGGGKCWGMSVDRGQCPDTVPEWHQRNLVTLMVDAVLRSSIGRILRRSRIMHEGRAEKMSDVIREAKVLVKDYT